MKSKPNFTAEGIELYCGDCLEILPNLAGIDAVITDPPYGGKHHTNYADRFSPKAGKMWSATTRHKQARHAPMIGENMPFDPAPILSINCPVKVLWGANWYANRLPDSGAWWMWDKRGGKRDVTAADWPLSEGELAWTNVGRGVRIFRHTWFGLIRDTELGDHFHPTQKPIVLMQWCMEKAKVRVGGTVADLYMGSGTTAIACIRTGRKFIGVEKDPFYFNIAKERIERELQQLILI